jgi:hypothetical protein
MAISKQENAHSEAVFLVASEFNAGKLKSALCHFYQHVTCATTQTGSTSDKLNTEEEVQ